MAQVEKSPFAVFLYLACLRAGLIFVPLNTSYTRDELDYFFEDAEPFLVVAEAGSQLEKIVSGDHGSRFETLEVDGTGTLTEGLAELEAHFETAELTADDVAAILYTSGTTGKPKGAMLTHGNLGNNCLALHKTWGFDSDDVLLHVLPIFHTHGLFVAINCSIMSVIPMIFLSKFDAAAVCDQLNDATVMMGVPTFYSRLLDHPGFSAESCRNIRLFISGSAPLTRELHQRFQAHTGHVILERYGMTETNMICSNPLNGERRAGTVGFPLPDVKVRVTDDNGSTIADGGVGNIEVSGPNVFKGYWKNPEKTKQEFTVDGYFKTGDIGGYTQDAYLEIVGRSKDLIISGGYNVYPKEVEIVLDSFDEVDESAVIGVPHNDFGEGVLAVVIQAKDELVRPGEVIRRAKAHLASYKSPKGVVVVSELPRNAMGKVEKKRLREQYSDYFTD